MTKFYKKNDDLLRNKLTQHEFAPVPGAWDNMSKLLSQQQIVPKRLGGLWWSVPIVAATVLLGIIGFGTHLNSNEASNEHQKPLAAQIPNSPSLTNSNKNAIGTTTVITTEEDVKLLATTTTTTKESIAVEDTKTSATKNKFNTPVVNKTTTTTTTKKQPKRSTFNNKATVGSNNNAGKAPAPDEQPNSSTTTTAGTSTNTSKDASNLANAIQASKAASSDSKIKVFTRIVNPTIYQYSTTTLQPIQTKRKAMQTPQNTIGNFGIGEELNHKKSPIKIGVFGGVSTKMYGQTKAFSVMPYAGVTASYKVARRHGLQVGIQYKCMGYLPTARENDNNAVLNYTQGNNTSTAHSMNRIDILEIPLIYEFYPHHQFNVHMGVKGAWLFNKETTSPKINNMPNEELGLANFDIGMLLGMEFFLNKNWSIGVQYSLGFINLTQQAKTKHEMAATEDNNTGINSYEKIQSLSSSGELIVPVSTDANHQEMIRLPNSLHNNDIQIRLKYTF
jgi:hypothetical protein